jgi:hypothetical protein
MSLMFLDDSVTALKHAGDDVGLLIYQGMQIFPEPEIKLPPARVRMVLDTAAYWYEFGWPSPELLDGNAADGWTDPGGYIRIRAERSEDLTTWDHQMDDAPGSPEDNGDGTWTYWARSPIPANWNSVMIDLTASTDRYAKSITAIQMFRTVLPLNYPYTPTEIADGTLQADLRNPALGNIPGATVSVTSGPLIATAKWHTQASADTLYVTMSGSNVVDVSYQGSTVAIAYPYAMPAQHAALASALTAALAGGPNDKAVVMLHGDTWTILLPDRTTTGLIRDLTLTISPDDPYPGWDPMSGSYMGMMSASGVSGTAGNVRTPAGAPLEERKRQFGRFQLGLGERYDA